MQSISNYMNNSTGKGKETKLTGIEFFAILFFLVYYLVPSISSALSMMFVLAAVGIYLIFLLVKNVGQSSFIVKLICLSFLIAFFYLILTNGETIGNVAGRDLKRFFSKFSEMIFTFFPVVILFRVLIVANKGQQRALLVISLLLFAYVVVNTSIELAVNENATKDWSEFGAQSEKNVGTYAYIYATTMIIVALPSLLMSLKNAWAKVLIIVVMALLLVFLLFAQYTLALIIALIGLVLQISVSIKQAGNRWVLFVVLFALTFFLPYFFELCAKIVPSEQMAIRLREMADFLNGKGDAGYNLGARLNLYTESILAFFESPIWGHRTLSFNGHATILTTFADIGLLGGIPLVMLFALTKNQINDNLDKKQKKDFSPVFVCMILMALTNPIHKALPLSFAVWFLIPFIIYCFIKGDEQ